MLGLVESMKLLAALLDRWPLVWKRTHLTATQELRSAYEQERIRRIMAESRTPMKRVPGREPWQ